MALKKAGPSLLWVHFVTKVSLTVLESVSKEDSFELFMALYVSLTQKCETTK
jgi:hypothetical protein